MIDAFLESLRWADLLLVVSTILAFFAFQVKGREKILGIKITADAIFGLYMILVGAYTGAAGAGCAKRPVPTPPKKTLQGARPLSTGS